MCNCDNHSHFHDIQEHHHNHNHNECCQHTSNKNIIIRLTFAIVFFAFGFLYLPFFFVAYILAGGDIVLNAIKNVIKRNFFDENFLMSIATIGAFCVKEFPEAVMVMILYQFGEHLQHWAVEKSKKSISELMNIKPDYANLDGEKVPPQNVKIGDVILIKTGEKIPLDGIVEDGSAMLDKSALTGESVPENVKKGDFVISGSININGVLYVNVTKEYSDSTVSKILDLVEHSASKKAKSEKFITRFAQYYTPIVVIMALLIVIIPTFYNPSLFSEWLKRALTFLVISCPCALVISIPLSFFAGIGSASKNGILIKGSSFIEVLSKVSNVVFDKTGTLTKGYFKVVEVVSEYPDFLKYVAFAESASSHPIALAIKKEYKNFIPEQVEIKEFAGFGVEAVVENKKVLVGSAKFVKANPINKQGSVVYVSIDGDFVGYIVVSDVLKEDSKKTIANLKNLGILTTLLSGDRIQSVECFSKELNIDNALAELMPNEKVEQLENIMQKAKGMVVFVGDGINDAPVLARADVGIAMGALGSDAAIESSDIVIMDDKPFKVVSVINIAKKTMGIVKQNIAFSVFVKILFLFLGGLGFMTMWGAVFADVGVCLLAILNSLRVLKIIK